MAIEYEVLGQPGSDNALWICVDSGQSRARLLFDCGDNCLRDRPVRELQSIDAVFFSHFHIDHIAGFDSFLRHNFARDQGHISIFGPRDAQAIIGNRLRGVTWNLVGSTPGEIRVHSIDENCITIDAFYTREGFAHSHRVAETPFGRTILSCEDFDVEAMILDHGTPSIGYVVREKSRVNIDPQILRGLGFSPGPWLKQVKDPTVSDEQLIDMKGSKLRLGDVRKQVLSTTPGATIAYLTDFSLDAIAEERVVEWLTGCQTLVCENNYRNADIELATASRHLVAADVGRVAKRANIGSLVVIHVSDRYTREEWSAQLAEIHELFANAQFPTAWQLS